MAWHRDSVSGSGLLLVFQVFIKKNGKMDLLVIEGVGWAVGLQSWFLCNLPSFRQFKGEF